MYNLCIYIFIFVYKYSRYNTYYMQLPLYIPCPHKSIKSPSFHFPIRVGGSAFRPEIERGSVPFSGWIRGLNLSERQPDQMSNENNMAQG